MAEEGAEGEEVGVGKEVGEELVFGRVGGEMWREGDMGEVAEGLGEVEGEAVVGVVAPEGGYVVGLFDDEEGDRLKAEGCGDRQARWACADDDRAIDPEPGRL